MVSFRKAQTGKRVYLGARQSPNRGQVSARGAQGYIQRELRKKGRMGVVTPRGRDGKSDRRSTVAAQALRRTFSQQPRFVGTPVKPNRPKYVSPTPPPGPDGGPLPQPNNPKYQPNNPQPPVTPNGEPQPQPPSTVTVSDEGILQLPYNQEFSLEQLQALQEANDSLLGLKVEADQQGLEYTQAKRNNQLDYDQLRMQTLNQNASRGTAFSSAYGTAVANNATSFANKMGDLEAQNTAFLNNQALQRAAIQSMLNQQLAASTQGYADDLGDEAGELGYGTDEGTVSPGQNTSIYGPNVKKNKSKGRNKKGNKGGKGGKGGRKGGSGKGKGPSVGKNFKEAAKRSLRKKKGKR